MPAIPPNRAERDDELRRLVLELDALEKKRSALQERLSSSWFGGNRAGDPRPRA